MAVSGRNISDFRDSMSLGSAEDFDHSCDSCLKDGQQVEANNFCIECKENLCKTCIRFHLRNKASKDHKMVDLPGRIAVTHTALNICTEKCSTHTNELIKFFCRKHQSLCCNDCVIIDHRNCETDYIPDKCSNRSAKEEFKSIMKTLSLKQAEYDDIMKRATVREKNIDICSEKAIQDMTDFQEEINKRIDELRKQVEEDAKEKKSKDKQEVQKVTNTCTKLSSDMNKYQTRLQHLNDSHQDADLFIAVKQAKLTLESEEIKQTEDVLLVSEMESVFKPSVDLDAFLYKKNSFGKMVTSLPTVKEALIDVSLTLKEDTAFGMSEDFRFITGCAILSPDKLVLADMRNRMVIIVDTRRKRKIEEIIIDSSPFDIAVLPNHQIAISMPSKGEVHIRTTRSKRPTTWDVLTGALVSNQSNLSIVHKIKVKRECKGISYHQGHLYVVCNDPNSVLIINTQGNVKNIITLNNDIFVEPQYIVFNEVSDCICISDSQSQCVSSITLQGEVSAIYKHTSLDRPRGLLLLHDGSLLVCCFGVFGNICHISKGLKQGQKILINDLPCPQSICYNQIKDEIYVGCYRDDKVAILQPQWQTN